jgi:hypothetical protein
MKFAGATYDPALDEHRLSKQLGRVYDCMSDGKWRTLAEIAVVAHGSEPAISARLRDLRKAEFGGYIVARRRVGDPRLGLFQYQLRGVTPAFRFDESGQGVFA